jgi:hypothetical protein
VFAGNSPPISAFRGVRYITWPAVVMVDGPQIQSWACTASWHNQMTCCDVCCEHMKIMTWTSAGPLSTCCRHFPFYGDIHHQKSVHLLSTHSPTNTQTSSYNVTRRAQYDEMRISDPLFYLVRWKVDLVRSDTKQSVEIS